MLECLPGSGTFCVSAPLLQYNARILKHHHHNEFCIAAVRFGLKSDTLCGVMTSHALIKRHAMAK